MELKQLKNALEAILMSAGKPIGADKLLSHFIDDEPRPSITQLKQQIKELQQDCEGRGIELKEVSSGFRYQARDDYGKWVSMLWEERPQRYSRALLETLALVAYRQPVTRADIEDVRGVGVSSSIIKTLLEREWIRVVGHRDVPGRPALFATTREFLDYFNMKSLDELPSLSEIKDFSKLDPELDLGTDFATNSSANKNTASQDMTSQESETDDSEVESNEEAAEEIREEAVDASSEQDQDQTDESSSIH